jgi:23S rRNA G2069 N7-methylase RlmK/C1962 C5-methylase RlmI
MGMGYLANFADTVEENFVKETCPKEFDALNEALNEDEDVTIDTVAADIENNPDDFTEEIQKAYKALKSAFKKKTGLDISIAYHDSNDGGDRYDDVNGVFWVLEFSSVYKMTPAASKIKDKIRRAFYVVFG